MVAAAPDGKHVYAVADGADAVTAFAVNPTSGAMTFVQAIKNGVGVANMADPVWAAVSADGKNVYVAARASSAVQVFARNTVTGLLTSTQTLLDGAAGGPALGDVTELAVSPDGTNVYAVSGTDSGLTIFARNPVTGALTFVQAITNGVAGVTALNQGRSVAVSPDGSIVYATNAFGRLLVFQRTMPGGALTQIALEGDPNVIFVDPLPSSHLAVTPDSEHVYQALGGIGHLGFTERAALRAFDTGTGTLRAGLGNESVALAAVGGGHAAFDRDGRQALRRCHRYRRSDRVGCTRQQDRGVRDDDRDARVRGSARRGRQQGRRPERQRPGRRVGRGSRGDAEDRPDRRRRHRSDGSLPRRSERRRGVLVRRRLSRGRMPRHRHRREQRDGVQEQR
jgi:hypothetical protein